MKNNPDSAIREYARAELISSKVEIPGVDFTKLDEVGSDMQVDEE